MNRPKDTREARRAPQPGDVPAAQRSAGQAQPRGVAFRELMLSSTEEPRKLDSLAVPTETGDPALEPSPRLALECEHSAQPLPSDPPAPPVAQLAPLAVADTSTAAPGGGSNAAGRPQAVVDPRVVEQIVSFAGLGGDVDGHPLLHLATHEHVGGGLSVSVTSLGERRIRLALRSRSETAVDVSQLIEALRGRGLDVVDIDLE
ncbi:MAG: hypothetical protein IT454_15215 [Planctomycetes bacterium]|nr:hypothetical protein [Planctomycetota bacterium]